MKALTLLLSLPFFLMLATGPFPFEVCGLSLDHLATGCLLVAASLGFLVAPRKKVYRIDILLLAYMISLIPSVILSVDFAQSLERYLISILYAVILSIVMRIDFGSRGYRAYSLVSLFVFSIVSLGCIYIYYFSAYSGNVRFALVRDYGNFDVEFYNGASGGVDPNMTAMGLVLLFTFSYQQINRIGNVRIKMLSASFLIVTFFVVLSIFASRTAFICALISFFPVLLKVLSRKQKRNFLVLVLLMLALMMPFFDGLFNNMIGRFGGSVSTLADDGRIQLMIEGYDIFMSSAKNILFGYGYFTLNPHNEYLRNFFCSGVVSGILYVSLLVSFYIACRNRAKIGIGHSGYVDALFFPFLFMLATYGHTKTFWVGLAFSRIVSGISGNMVSNALIIERRLTSKS